MMGLAALAAVLAIIHGVSRWAHVRTGGLFLADSGTWLNHQNSPALKLMLAVEQYSAVLAIWAAVAAIIVAYLAWGLPRLAFSSRQSRFSVLLEICVTILFALVILFLSGYACVVSGGQPLMIVGIPLAVQIIPILILGITLLISGIRALVALIKAFSPATVSSPKPLAISLASPSESTRTTTKPRTQSKPIGKASGVPRGTQPSPQRLKVTAVKPGANGKPGGASTGKAPRKGGTK